MSICSPPRLLKCPPRFLENLCTISLYLKYASLIPADTLLPSKGDFQCSFMSSNVDNYSLVNTNDVVISAPYSKSLSIADGSQIFRTVFRYHVNCGCKEMYIFLRKLILQALCDIVSVLLGKLEGKYQFGRPRRRWGDYITRYHFEIGWEGVNSLMYLWVS